MSFQQDGSTQYSKGNGLTQDVIDGSHCYMLYKSSSSDQATLFMNRPICVLHRCKQINAMVATPFDVHLLLIRRRTVAAAAATARRGDAAQLRRHSPPATKRDGVIV